MYKGIPGQMMHSYRNRKKTHLLKHNFDIPLNDLQYLAISTCKREQNLQESEFLFYL